MVAALKSNLTIADNYNKLSLSSGYTVPVDAERVIKEAALNCAEKYFYDEDEQGLPILTAMMAEFSIRSQAKKTNTIVAEILRACVTRGVYSMHLEKNLGSNIQWQCRCNGDLARGPACGVCMGFALPIDYFKVLD